MNQWLLRAGRWMKPELKLGLCLVVLGLGILAHGQAVSTTTVQGTVYLANGQTGPGTLSLSWPAFTTAGGQAVAAGSLTATIGADGFASVNLAPNVGSTPAGLYYTAIYQMSDGTTSTEYWVVPAAAQATIGQVRAQLMPAVQALQAVSKSYVDQSIAQALSSQLTASGGNLTGPLFLSADPTQAMQAADKHYVDASFAQAVPLAGGNMTGALQTPTVNGVQSPATSSGQTTLQSAMSAAGATGAMVIPPNYAGNDGFTNPNGVRVNDLRTSGAQQAERSVKEFGAVCDGLTDDTNALQAALNYAQTHGVALTIPQGTCKTHSLNWHGESIGGLGKQVSALMGFPGQDVLSTLADNPNLLAYTRIHDLTIYVDQSIDTSCSAAAGRAPAGSCTFGRTIESNSIFSPGGNGLNGTKGTGPGWSVGNCAIAMPAITGSGGNGLRVAEVENVEIAVTGVDPMAAQYPGAHSTHTCGLYLAQWPQWSEFRNIDIRGVNTGIVLPALPGAVPAGLTADSNRWQNITIQATHGFAAQAGSGNVLDNVVATVGNSAATAEPPTGLVLDFPGQQNGWAVRNSIVTPTWTAVQPLLTVTAAGGAVTAVTVGAEHGLGFDPYGTQVALKFSGSCTAQANAAVNNSGSIGAVTVTQGGVGCSATTTASVNVAGGWDTVAPVNLIGGQNISVLAGNLLKGNGGYTVWNAASSSANGTQLNGGGGNLPGGGTYPALVATSSLGSAIQVEQLPGADFGAKLQSCLGMLSASYGGTCDARNFTGTLAMGSNLTISTANATVLLPCATISTANQMIVTAGTRNVSLRGCALRGASSASGSQGGTAFVYSGTGAMVQVGDPTYASDTMGFHMDNVLINTTTSASASAQGVVAYRTQEMDLESLYLLGNANQTGMTLDGTGNYTGGTFFDNAFNGFLTAVNGIGHQAANPATTDWLNASTFVRLHIDCPTNNGSPVSGTTGINLAAGDGNTITGGDVEGCSTALHLGSSAENNTIVGLRNENSGNQIVADAGSQYNSWVTGGAMFTGKLVDNGTHNSFWDAFHRSFNNLNGDLWRSQSDATITDHVYTGVGLGNVRGKMTEYQTDVPGTANSYQNAWIEGLTDGTTGVQFYQIEDLLNNVNRISVGQYNNGSSTNNQTVVNSAGTGAVVLNGSNNAGTGGVVVGSGGATETTVATISNAGNAQFNGTLLVGGTSQSAGTMTVRNSADAEVDYYLTPGLTTSQKGSFTYKDWNGASQWYMVKDASNNWALNSATGGLDSLKAYQSTNTGDTYVNASNATGHVRLNYEAGAGAETDIYSGGSANLVAAFQGLNSIKFPGLAAASGHDCIQIDSAGFLTNTGAACGSGSGSTNGTVNSGNTGQIAFYNGTGTAVSGINQVPLASGGTGAGTAAGALANLGAAALAGATFSGPVNAQSVEGQLQADQWQSPGGTGNNGIAMSIAQCAQQAYVCSIVAPALYAQVEAQPWSSGNTLEMMPSQEYGPKSTDPLGCVTDYRWGPPQVICNQGQAPMIGGITNRYAGASAIFNQNVTTGGNGFSPVTPQGLSVFTHVFSGGRDSYLDETDQTNLNTLMQSNTPGVVYDWQSRLNTFAPGDTIPIISWAYGVGSSAGQNEGFDYHLRLGETGNVFEGTLSGVPSCGVTCTFAVTQTMGAPGGIGSGVPLIDITNGYNTGYIASIGSNYTLAGSGTNWTSLNSTTPVSSITTTTTNIDNANASASTFPQTNVQVTVTSASGFTATGNPVACLFSDVDLKWTCAHVTAVAGSVVTLDRVDFGFPAGSTIATGGVTGYGFGFDVDTVTAANMNGFSSSSDQAVNGPIRQVYPVVGNASATSLTVYLFGSGGTRALANNGTATSNAYHLWPQALVLDAYNHATGALDGSALLTTPEVGTFRANDLVEQPHYFSVLVEGLNLAVNKYQATPENTSTLLDFSLGGNFISGDSVGRFNNLNDPTIYLGLPANLQSSVTGRNVLTTPLGLVFSGAFQSAIKMTYPPFGAAGSQQIGTVVQGCGATPTLCAQWNQAIPILNVRNGISAYAGVSAEDVLSYNPSATTWNLSAGSTGLGGGLPAASMSLGPNGLSVSNIAASNAPVCPNGVNGALTTAGCATGTGGGGLPVNNPAFTGALSGPVMDVKATSNNIVYADQFAGSTWDVKVAAALAQACPVSGFNTVPVTNGVVDARGLIGWQTMAATVTMTPNCELILGQGTITRANGVQLLVDSGDTVMGANPGLGFVGGRGSSIEGVATDTSATIAYRYGTGGSGGYGIVLKDFTIIGPAAGTGLNLQHVTQTQVNNVVVTGTAVGLVMGFPGGCDCYNSFSQDFFFTTGYGVQLNAFANQNQFYGGRFQSTGSSSVYDNGAANTFYAPDIEGGFVGFEFGSQAGADGVYSPYVEGNTTDVLIDSNAVGNSIIGGTALGHITDNSGNTSNFIFTTGAGANQGGNTPTMWAVNTLRFGGNLYGGSVTGGEMSLSGLPDGGAQFNFSAAEVATYGRIGGFPLHVGPLYSAGASNFSYPTVSKLPDPPAPTLGIVGTAGTATLTYAVVCYAQNTATNIPAYSLPSALATITNAPATLNSSNYVTITTACGPGYNGAYILKGGTSGTVELVLAGPNFTSNDQGGSLSSYTPPSRNTTGDMSVGGYFNALQYSLNGAVVIPPTVGGYQGTSGTKVQLGTGTPTAGHCANFAADGSIEDAGAACASLTQNSITFANGAANADYIILQPGTGSTDQIGSFELANYAGTSEWELRKDALEVFRLHDSVNGADRLLAYQGGQTMMNSAGSSAVVVNDSTGSGTGGFIVYGGGASPAAALTVTSSGNTTAAGFVSGKFYTGNSAMTFTAGAGAGTSPTIACATNCTGAQGTYTVTVGTTPSAGTLVTLNFPNTHTNTADCVGNLYLPGTGQVTNWEPVAGVSSLGVKVDGSALAAGSQYKFTYWCGGF